MLSEDCTTRIPQKTVQKPLKTTEKAVAGTNILPQNPKSGDISPPPLCGNVENIQGCMHGCITPMYIRQADPIFFPDFFFEKNLVLVPTPPKLRKKYFFFAFWALWSLHYQLTSKNSPKSQKIQSQDLIFFPKKAKVLLFFHHPPHRGNLPFIHGWVLMLFLFFIYPLIDSDEH